MADRWIPIPGYEGRYSVSDTGLVRSEARVVESYGARRYLTRERVMKPQQKAGYPSVELFTDGRGRWCGIHTLVAAAFIGPRPAGKLVCHNDGNRTNNVPLNLRYDTPAGNQADRKLHGTERALSGEQAPWSKLTAEDVRRIRADDRPQRVAAADYGISASQFGRVRLAKYWKEVR